MVTQKTENDRLLMLAAKYRQCLVSWRCTACGDVVLTTTFGEQSKREHVVCIDCVHVAQKVFGIDASKDAVMPYSEVRALWKKIGEEKRRLIPEPSTELGAGPDP